MAGNPRYSKFFQTPRSEAESEEELRAYNLHKELISSLPCKGHTYCYGGFWCPEWRIVGLLSAQKHFKASPGDIFLCTYPKSGTTWIRALAFSVINRGAISDYKDHPLLTMSPQDQDCALYLEGIFAGAQVPDLSVLTGSPRLFASHIPYSLLPDSVKNGCRIVYVSRDPKDTLISLWHYSNLVRGPTIPFFRLDDLFEEFCRGGSYFGPIWDHQVEYQKESLNRPDMVLFMKYEEMKAKPEESVRKLASFVGQPFTKEEEEGGTVEKIVRLCSFEFLKDLPVNKEGIQEETGDRIVKNSSFFRKGRVGDWKELLTPDMADRIDHITQQKLSQHGLI